MYSKPKENQPVSFLLAPLPWMQEYSLNLQMLIVDQNYLNLNEIACHIFAPVSFAMCLFKRYHLSYQYSESLTHP